MLASLGRSGPSQLLLSLVLQHQRLDVLYRPRQLRTVGKSRPLTVPPKVGIDPEVGEHRATGPDEGVDGRLQLAPRSIPLTPLVSGKTLERVYEVVDEIPVPSPGRKICNGCEHRLPDRFPKGTDVERAFRNV